LVLEAFVGEPPLGAQGNHKDGNSWNNDIQNLEWLSGEDNRHHAKTHNLIPKRYGEANPRSKLNDEAVRVIRRDRAAGVTIRSLATRFGVTEKTIALAASKRSWPHID